MKRDYRDFARAAAQFQDYAFPEREQRWLGRLGANQREIDAFHSAPEPGGHPVLMPPPVGVARAQPLPGGAAKAVAPPAGSARAITQAVRKGERSARSFIEAALAAADANAHLNAFITLAGEQALASADAIDRRVAGGGAGNLPLAGVPLAVKDLMQVAGLPMTGGSRSVDALVSREDAEAVRRLREAGAIVLGTANLHELAYGVTSDNIHFGRVGNPRAPGCIPGGSSGGSAAALAAGIVALATGTDTGASIRLPSGLCGTVGFKPTFDAVSRKGVMDLGTTLDTVGPMATNVGDCALMFEVMAGLAPGTAASMAAASLKGVRVLKPVPYYFDDLDEELRAGVEAAIERMAGDGAAVQAGAIEMSELAPAMLMYTLATEAAQVHHGRLRERGHDMSEEVRVRLEMGQFFLGTEYVRAQQLRAAFRANMIAALTRHDVLALPTMRIPAPESGQTHYRVGGRQVVVHTAMSGLTSPFNVTNVPAISIPCGATRQGKPIALQLVAAPGQDYKLLAIAARVEELLRA
jgi:Asp-tRNA(Asn)/Glu-tRNA(Gln) amidotransferase A subunit family amidase